MKNRLSNASDLNRAMKATIKAGFNLKNDHSVGTGVVVIDSMAVIVMTVNPVIVPGWA